MTENKKLKRKWCTVIFAIVDSTYSNQKRNEGNAWENILFAG